MKLTYPITRTENIIESYLGVEQPDPYRWLEDDTREVQAWQREQNRLAEDYVRAWPGFEDLKKSVEYCFVDRITTVPRFAGGKWFRADKIGVIVSDSPYGVGRVVFDLRSEAADTLASLSWLSPSPSGRTLAVGVCPDGSEHNTIRLVDVETGELLPHPPPHWLMDGWTGGACWLPDSSGFYYLALEGERKDFRQRIWFYNMADGTQVPAEIPYPDPESRDYTVVSLSPQGRFLVASQGVSVLTPIALRDLSQSDTGWQPFVTTRPGTIDGFVWDDRLIAVTDVGASRGRVVAIPLGSPAPEDPASWTELVPESDAVIRSITPVGEVFYLSESVNTYSRVRIIDTNGQCIGQVPLPGNGAIAEAPFHMMNRVPNGHPEEYLFAFSTLTASWGGYRHRPGEHVIETLRPPEISIDNAVMEDRCAVSHDGVRIPYHTVRLATTEKTAPRPTLLFGYGGYNVPILPEYPGALAAFVAAGGTYVLAHLRGGAELGSDWWQGGRMQNKQNCYQDLYAVAEDLIRKGKTTPQQLAVTGRSNGGLMAGVALTQRPELWRVIVPQVPVLDLLGGLRDPYARYHIALEYADPTDPNDIRRMLGLSAYHLIKDGTAYPATYIVAGNTDPRCRPFHARKFAARLQAANASESPVLLRVWDHAGHGQGTVRSIQLLQYTEWLAFVMQQLGMTPEAMSKRREGERSTAFAN